MFILRNYRVLTGGTAIVTNLGQPYTGDWGIE